MRYVCALFATCALLLGTAWAQQYPNQYPNQQYPNQQYPNQQYPQNTAPVYAGNVIPAGTQLSIRTNENIAADQNTTNRTFSAEVAQDVMGPNGQMLIPQGSPALLTVQKISNGTLGVGSTQVALALQSVSINGQQYAVMSNTATESGNKGIGANKRTAEMTGGGALLGTVIGAIAGGGKGAVLGGLAGAGAGATAQVLTRGKQVNVPAETLLTFRLDQPLTLSQASGQPQNGQYPQTYNPPPSQKH